MHLEAPTPDRLTRLIRSAAHTFEQQFYEATLARFPEETQAALEALLSTEIAAPKVRDADGEREGEQVGQAPLDAKDTSTQTEVSLQHLRMYLPSLCTLGAV